MQEKVRKRFSSLLQPHWRPKDRGSLAGIQRLPQEILDQIFDQLSSSDVRCFALCNRRAFASAISVLYGTITLDMSKAGFAANSLAQWTTLLHKRHLFEVPRTVSIKGRTWTYGPNIRTRPSKVPNKRPLDKSLITAMTRNYMDDYDMVVRFLGKLPQLRRIELDLEDVVPPVLLEAFITGAFSKCRISLHNVLFTPHLTTVQEVTDQFRIPNLVSATIIYHQQRELTRERALFPRTFDVFPEEMPHLKHLAMKINPERCPKWCSGLSIPEILEEQPLKSPCNPRRLETLALSQTQIRSLSTPHPTPFVASLDKYIDVSYLRVLHLYGFLGPDLNWAADHCYFTNLRELEIRMELEVEDAEQWQEATNAAKKFVLSVPPVSCLRLLRVGSPNDFRPLLEHHGSTLTSLTVAFHRDLFFHDRLNTDQVYFAAGQVEIMAISQCCPRLQSLELEVRREFSGGSEKAVYQSLGTLPKLQDLTVNIDCTFVDGIDVDLPAKFMNSAIDEALGRSIWQLIMQNSTSLSNLNIYSLCNSAYPSLVELCRSMEIFPTYEAFGASGLLIKYVSPSPTSLSKLLGWRDNGWFRPNPPIVERNAVKSVWNVSINDHGWQEHCHSLPFD